MTAVSTEICSYILTSSYNSSYIVLWTEIKYLTMQLKQKSGYNNTSFFRYVKHVLIQSCHVLVVFTVIADVTCIGLVTFNTTVKRLSI